MKSNEKYNIRYAFKYSLANDPAIKIDVQKY